MWHSHRYTCSTAKAGRFRRENRSYRRPANIPPCGTGGPAVHGGDGVTSASFLQGETVALRAIESDDLAFIRDGVNHPAVWRSLGGQTLPTNLEIERGFYETANHDDDTVQLLMTVDGARTGVIELSPIDWIRGVAEVNYWVHPDRQREGIAADAVRTVAGYAFGDLRLRKLTAEVAVTNEASRRTVESAGFEREGTLVAEDFVEGEPVDVIRYGLLAAER